VSSQQAIVEYVTNSGAGSGWKFLSSATAAASATLEFTADIDATYYMYAFVFTDIKPATDSALLNAQTSANAGVAWDTTGGDYHYVYTYSTPGTVAAAGSSSTAFFRLSHNIGNAANEFVDGLMYLYNPSSTEYTMMNFQSSSLSGTGVNYANTGQGTRLSAAAVNGVRFLMSSGNITSGTIKMYGCCTPA
jgi:hypothetical protein